MPVETWNLTGTGASVNWSTSSNWTVGPVANPLTAAGATETGIAAGIGGTNATLDFTGLTGFKATQAGAFVVNGNGLVTKLGAGTAITTGESDVGTGDYGTSTNTTSALTLGKSTTINADTLHVDNYHANGNPGVTAGQTGATVTLRGTAGGASRQSLVVGLNSAGTAVLPDRCRQRPDHRRRPDECERGLGHQARGRHLNPRRSEHVVGRCRLARESGQHRRRPAVTQCLHTDLRPPPRQ